MSQENVEVVRKWMQECSGAEGDIDAALRLVDPEFEMTEAPSLPGAHSLRGHDALRRYFAGWRRNWSEWSWHADEVIDVPPDVVVVDARLSLRGLRSAALVEHRWAYVFKLRGARLVRQDGFDTRADALEAVGLRE
jgi:ketosteroid isomerase-like protein